ncbi:MLO-like protein 6 isoform X2 [Cryptomeria japonica]|uniref:MLO-like protein 6 isoform X2 n=1 Tax=Cryptomeria japonica TaxID=3369 RepID=UPI0025AC61BB|nr:MLO-like protein 6 isoform X2 [Cryptomeria japonica]
MAGAKGRSLEETPTWAVSVVCLVFIVISITLEQLIHGVGKRLLARKKNSLYEALDKIKSELMLMGFISLLLTIGEKPISMICISKEIADSMLPCDKKKVSKLKCDIVSINPSGCMDDHCKKHDKYPLVSKDGMHQLHIFIFILTVLHVLFSVLTMALARAKMRRWKSWEKETQTMEYQFSNDAARFRFTHETSFVRRHTTFWSPTPVLKWIVCFFRQFFWSVSKVDYLALRHGFIVAHLAPNSKFDFQKYIKRSLDDDFKVIVGISPPLWAFAVVFLLLNVSGWYAYFWLSFVPLCIILLVGMKLQVIITEMAIEIHERHAVVKGEPLVQPSDERFWFNRPKLVLSLIHFTLFQNAFQIAFFLWIWFLCSYITLPLYALVTQMGSHMKKAIFEEQTANALKKWHQSAKKNRKKNKRPEFSGFRSGETTPDQGSSPIHLLHKCKTMGDIECPEISGRNYCSDHEALNYEMEQISPSPPHPLSSQHTRTVSTFKTEKNTEAT